MKQFKINPEYYDMWGAYEGNDTVTDKEIAALAAEWETPVDALMEQVEEA